MQGDDPDQAADDDWYERKTARMVELLGPEHDMVMHAIIPYAIGGALDLYYFPNSIAPGTAIATKELSEAEGEGSSNDFYDCYEFVMFTQEELDLDQALDATTPFGRAHDTINRILNVMAPYSAQATLNPFNTCEFPEEMEHLGGKCLIADAFRYDAEHAGFGLMLLMEVFRSELEYAREHGGDALVELLIEQGHYPYSDMDRESVA